MIRFTINGRSAEVDVPDTVPLLWVIREELLLTGTKYGCGKGLCGACTVHLNGGPVRSCVLPAAAVQGQAITTIEGITGPGPHPVQKAWIKHGVPQCGYCQSGQIMQAIGHLNAATEKLTEAEVVSGVSGNLCRCGTYNKIALALVDAAKDMGKVK